MLGQWLTSIGIVLATVGAGLLFVYGAPFLPRTKGQEGVSVGEELPNVVAREKFYDLLSWAGFALGTAGAGLQLAGAWIP